ncbi:MAG TPA: tetratricopeptide repeat protein [Gemmatimonadales bacterium]|nr:tetratricopeptide repeat protein [Gemmatimonadales bacterium]
MTLEGIATPALAVLPFTNASGDPAKSYLATGLSRYLTLILQHVTSLGAAPRPGKPVDAATILDGSVNRTATHLSLTLELTQNADGARVWTARYDRKLDDIVIVVQEAVAQILTALQITPRDVEQRILDRVPTAHARAFETYVHGRELYQQIRRRSQDLAHDLFAEAVKSDPGFALAHAGRADCHAMLYSYWDSSADHLREADTASARAVELDGARAEIRVSRGLALSLNKRVDEAEREFARALELNPTSFDACYFRARSCRGAGHMEEAVAWFERAGALRPDDYATPALLATAYVSLGRTDDAMAVKRRALDIMEGHLKANPDDERALYLGATCLTSLGDKGRAREWAKRAVAMEPDDSAVLYNVACAYSLLGLKDSAIDCLERAVQNGFGHWEWIQHDSDLDPLRDQPRFQALVQRQT